MKTNKSQALSSPRNLEPDSSAVNKRDGLIFALFNEDLWLDGVC